MANPSLKMSGHQRTIGLIHLQDFTSHFNDGRVFYRIQYLLFPDNDKKSVFFPNRFAVTKRASIRGPRYRGKFGDIRAYIQTYKHILKRGLLRAQAGHFLSLN